MKSMMLALIGIVPLGYATYHMWTSAPVRHSLVTESENKNATQVANRVAMAETNTRLLKTMLDAENLSAIKRHDENVVDTNYNGIKQQMKAQSDFMQLGKVAKEKPSTLESELADYFVKTGSRCGELADKVRYNSNVVPVSLEAELKQAKASLDRQSKETLDLLDKRAKFDVVFNECDSSLKKYNTIDNKQPKLRQLFDKVKEGLKTLETSVKSTSIPQSILLVYTQRIELMERAIKFREEIERLSNVISEAKVIGLEKVINSYKDKADSEDYSFKPMFTELRAELIKAQFATHLYRLEQIAEAKSASREEMTLLLKTLKPIKDSAILTEGQNMGNVQKQLKSTVSRIFCTPPQFEKSLKNILDIQEKHFKAEKFEAEEKLKFYTFEMLVKQATDTEVNNKQHVGMYKIDSLGGKIVGLLFLNPGKNDYQVGNYAKEELLTQLTPWKCVLSTALFSEKMAAQINNSARIGDDAQWQVILKSAKDNQFELDLYRDKTKSVMSPALRADVESLHSYYEHVIKCIGALTADKADWKLFQSFFAAPSANNP